MKKNLLLLKLLLSGPNTILILSRQVHTLIEYAAQHAHIFGHETKLQVVLQFKLKRSKSMDPSKKELYGAKRPSGVDMSDPEISVGLEKVKNDASPEVLF